MTQVCKHTKIIGYDHRLTTRAPFQLTPLTKICQNLVVIVYQLLNVLPNLVSVVVMKQSRLQDQCPERATCLLTIRQELI